MVFSKTIIVYEIVPTVGIKIHLFTIFRKQWNFAYEFYKRNNYVSRKSTSNYVIVQKVITNFCDAIWTLNTRVMCRSETCAILKYISVERRMMLVLNFIV